MPDFIPYVIHHMQLLEPEAFTPPAGNAYVVFWWRQVPLGHLWMEARLTLLPVTDFLHSVLKAVTPALRYYFRESPLEQNWQTAFVNGDTEVLRQLLQTNPELQTFSNPHATGKLSVVICTRNRTQALEQCIKALLKSTDTDFELVIVDNAPDDNGTQEL